MKIGIDIDDTICNTWEFVKPYYEKKFNLDKNITENNSYFKALNCSLEEYYDFCKKNIYPSNVKEFAYDTIKRTGIPSFTTYDPHRSIILSGNLFRDKTF